MVLFKKMTDNLRHLISLLSDGQIHSGPSLGKQLAITRSGIWKLIKQAESLDIEILKNSKTGYQIPGGIDFLEAETIKNVLSPLLSKNINLIIEQNIPSTNDYLKTYFLSDLQKISVCVAERQSAGKGRFNRKWYSPYGKNLYFSLCWNFFCSPNDLSGLSLAMALAIIEGLTKAEQMPPNLGLKWPNDVFCTQKIGGTLIEVQGEINGECSVIIGVGVNISMPSMALEAIKTPWTDLERLLLKKPSRNTLLAILIEEMIKNLDIFQQQGFTPFKEKWAAYDLSLNHPVSLTTARSFIKGTGRGIDHKGNFLIEESTGLISSHSSGEVSLLLDKDSL